MKHDGQRKEHLRKRVYKQEKDTNKTPDKDNMGFLDTRLRADSVGRVEFFEMRCEIGAL